MDSILNHMKAAFVFLSGLLCWAIGKADSLFYALIAFVVIDYITGILLAIVHKNLSSAIGYKGIFKKITIFILVALGNIMDQFILNSGNSLKNVIILFYLSNEGISILENSAKLGLPLPQKLKDILQNISEGKK